MIFSDIQLARRIEMTDALGGAAFADAHVKLFPETGAASMAVGGGCATFAGVDSPCTQAFGLGLNGAAEEDLEQLEEFYRSRGSAVNVEACPLADVMLLKLFNERGYRPMEFTNVLVRPLNRTEYSGADGASAVSVREAVRGEYGRLAHAVAKGFSESFPDGEPPQMFIDLFKAFTEREGTKSYLAEVGGEIAGGGFFSLHNHTASFFGASTLPAFRNRGIQNALLNYRLAAASKDCDLAMIATAPGSGSQRNAERFDFRVVYTRTKFVKEWK